MTQGRNIEIKARARDFRAQGRIAARMADEPPASLWQRDTFFHVTGGRLKLREFEDGTGELIHYRRADSPGPKESGYVRSPTADPPSLKEALARSLGIRAVVEKKRTVVVCGQARIHLDEVAGLGRFIEIEVVLRPDQTTSEGVAMAETIMARLGIERSHLVSCAYVDLLTEEGRDEEVESAV